MNKSMQRAQLALDKAAEQMAQAKAENRQEFRQALAELYLRYGLFVDATGVDTNLMLSELADGLVIGDIEVPE